MCLQYCSVFHGVVPGADAMHLPIDSRRGGDGSRKIQQALKYSILLGRQTSE